jgi:agmatinase
MAEYDASQIGEETGDTAFMRQSPYGGSYEATYSGATSFLRCQYTRNLNDMDVAVSGVPFDLATTGRPGARLGPRAVRTASTNLAWDWPQGWNFNPLDKLKVADWGDCTFDPGQPDIWIEKLEEHASNILATDTAMLTLGGDHFITYPMLKAHAAKHGPLSLIHFDAHSDTWDDTPGRIDHGTMFFHAKEQGLIVPERSAQIGLRTRNPKTHGFNIIEAPEACRATPQDISTQIKSIVGDEPTYLTFDIDCLDPAYAPGTGTPCSGGLTTRQALDILCSLRGINLVGMDVVEVAPAYDVSEITALAGATIAYQLLALYAANHEK